MRRAAGDEHDRRFGVDLQRLAEILDGVDIIAFRLIGAGAIDIGRELVVGRLLVDVLDHLRAAGDPRIRIRRAALAPGRADAALMLGQGGRA